MATNFMNPVSLVLTFLCVPWCTVLSVPFIEFMYPNFSTSFIQYIDRSGAFLLSRNGTFTAAMCCPGNQQVRSYLCVLHSESNTVIWSANGDAPVSTSGKMNFTSTSILITEIDGTHKWSTPAFQSPIFALRLTDQGNLLLLSESNQTLWQSFDRPTDTIVSGQTGVLSLRSSNSADDLGTGDYNLSLMGSDAILQWQGLTYWKLSMETKAYTDSTSYAADYIIVNGTGLYLLGLNGSTGVIQLNLPPPSAFRIAKLDYTGQLTVKSLVGVGKSDIDFAGPGDSCRIPYICGKLGLCINGVSATMPLCSCPSNFKQGTQNNNISSCVPIDASFSLPSSCNSTTNNSTLNSPYVSYMRLGNGVNYFSNDFSKPSKYGINLSDCQNLCTKDCNCYGLYFDDSSGSCSLVENRLGSFILTKDGNDGIGYVKNLVRIENNRGGRSKISRPGLVMLPLASVFILFVFGYILWRRSRRVQKSGKKVKSFRSNSSSLGDDEEEAFSIRGLPVRFQYSDIETATENFKTEIGSGGFGSVYKGVLPDKSIVAVKKINNIGIQGKKDFCAEIAVIGNIHHVNLVKLKGYCAQGKHRLLVYEYMNRSSLDRSLFRDGPEPVLEWKERVEIAIGAARGLAYLHCGCEHKIIHCDVKPENILLHDRLQAKLSDFGLSKLLSPEQSSHFTTMRGTRGYLAPEWLTSSVISEKTDVYSFGMMLLEIVSGRKNCPSQRSQNIVVDKNSSGDSSNSSSSQHKLVYFPLYALEMHEQKRYMELADSRLEGRVSSEEVEKFVCVGLCCVHEEPSLRPNMVDVIGMLDGSIPFCKPKIGSLNFLRFYGHRFSEPSMVQGTQTQQNDAMLHPLGESPTLTSGSHAQFSYISSQQISGPR